MVCLVQLEVLHNDVLRNGAIVNCVDDIIAFAIAAILDHED